ncbi:MAG TPA: type II CAAX endopeptidase family protein, partial [Actinomycetota bacterium]|nr:type II CAAX endopeptidase family protein [Actinomycetota bacterium]
PGAAPPWPSDDGPPPLPDGATESEPAALPPVPWHWLESFAVFMLTFVTAGLLAVVVAAAFSGDLEKAMAVVVFEVALAGWALLWPKIRFGLGPRALGLRRDQMGGDIRYGLGIGVVGWVVSTLVVGNVVVRLVERITDGPVTEPDQLNYSDPSGLVLTITAIGVIVIAPIAEEIFFRGFVFRGFRRDVGFVIAAVASSILFMFAHLPFWIIFPSIFTLGLFLSRALEKRASLIPCIVAHALFNSAGFAAYMITLN